MAESTQDLAETRTEVAKRSDRETTTAGSVARGRRITPGRILSLVLLLIGALVFLFPFWYMVVGAFQLKPDPTVAGAFPDPSTLTVDNFIAINERLNLLVTLRNSLIFTLGVIVSTLVLGLLAGYALAVLNFRGRGAVFGIVLLSLILPFQLLMIPLFVMIVRTYGLADTFLGMILPFAVNATAVFIFRQFFLAVPQSLFDAARVDGAGELRILLRVAVPIARPAILTAVLVTFIGPWNEFLWPFLITKQANLQPLAVALANFISTVAGSTANPVGAILAGATVLAIPVVVLFLVFQRYFQASDLGAGVKG
ncbi:MAG TPA: carbohydrate ABC transporter permease [Acidimicrobiia bacterium]|jgi:multiple sugar transport system permease protein|nr:carbohydrate ABC transporter permease [Acidimicrobiia bacterium]